VAVVVVQKTQPAVMVAVAVALAAIAQPQQ
jgi:hypothetical protein